MNAALATPRKDADQNRGGPLLPAALRLLFVSESYCHGRWLSSALAADGACSILVDEAADRNEGLQRLRQTSYDAVLISHEPPQLDAFEWLESMQAGGLATPAIILGTAREADLAPLCFEAGAEAYISLHSATTRVLIWTVARARQRHQLWLENRRWRQADAQRTELDQQEQARLLDEYLSCATSAGNAPAIDQPAHPHTPESVTTEITSRALEPAWTAAYDELLRVCLMAGVTRQADGVASFAERWVKARLAPATLLQLHHQRLQAVLSTLGPRGTRHALQRGDQLIVQLLAQVAQAYREHLERVVTPARQLWLLDLDAA